MLELSSKPKEPKPPKEKKVYYSSRGGAGRSKSVGPVARKPLVSTTPSIMLEVPVPTNKTTSTGRGGSANARTFVVEEGTFERVMEFETGKILAMKNADGKRKTISLRGGAAIPDGTSKKKEKSPTSPTSTRGSSQFSDDQSSSKSVVSRFPRVPSFNGNFFSRERPPSPSSVSPSQSSGGSAVAPNASLLAPNGTTSAPSGSQVSTFRHCSTCQCWRHTTSTQLSLDIPPSPVATSPPPSLFKTVSPGVLLYVPEEPNANGPPPSPTGSSVYSYYRESQVLPPSPEAESNPRGARYYHDSVLPPS